MPETSRRKRVLKPGQGFMQANANCNLNGYCFRGMLLHFLYVCQKLLQNEEGVKYCHRLAELLHLCVSCF